MEKPLELWKDIMDFVEVAWVMRTRSCELGLYWVSRPSLRRANHSRPHESQATHPGSTLQSRGQKHHKSKEVDSPWGRVVPTSPVRSTSSNSKDRSKVNRIALLAYS